MNLEQHHVFLLLGSNVGDRMQHLTDARKAIERNIGTIIQASRVYETEAWGVELQGPFLNQALEIETALSPEEVLQVAQSVEHQSGRTRSERWGPRTLDIDIAFYDDRIINSADLTVPHPGIHQRNFALIPLIEIAGHMMHPVLQTTLKELFEQSTDRREVSILGGG